MKRLELITIAVLTFLLVGCSDDDDMRPLTVTESGFTFDTINTCDIGSGPFGTRFDFQIELQSVPAIDVDGVEFDLEWSDGDESQDLLEDDLIITGSTVEYDWCFRFGGTDWFELTQTLVDVDGKPLSNEVKVRVNKPVGAN